MSDPAAAFVELYVDVQPAMIRYFLSRGFSLDEVDDLAADTWEYLWKKISAGDEVNRSYAMQTAKHRLFDYVRRSRVRSHLSLDDHDPGDYRAMQLIESHLDTEAMIRCLPEHYQEAIRFRIAGGMYRELAAHLGLTDGAALRRIQQARKYLRTHYTRMQEEPS